MLYKFRLLIDCFYQRWRMRADVCKVTYTVIRLPSDVSGVRWEAIRAEMI